MNIQLFWFKFRYTKNKFKSFRFLAILETLIKDCLQIKPKNIKANDLNFSLANSNLNLFYCPKNSEQF